MCNASLYQMVLFFIDGIKQFGSSVSLQCIPALGNGTSLLAQGNSLNCTCQREGSIALDCLVCRVLLTGSFLSLKQSNYIQISVHGVALSSKGQ